VISEIGSKEETDYKEKQGTTEGVIKKKTNTQYLDSGHG
jgi:hypothetical protein